MSLISLEGGLGLDAVLKTIFDESLLRHLSLDLVENPGGISLVSSVVGDDAGEVGVGILNRLAAGGPGGTTSLEGIRSIGFACDNLLRRSHGGSALSLESLVSEASDSITVESSSFFGGILDSFLLSSANSLKINSVVLVILKVLIVFGISRGSCWLSSSIITEEDKVVGRGASDNCGESSVKSHFENLY